MSEEFLEGQINPNFHYFKSDQIVSIFKVPVNKYNPTEGEFFTAVILTPYSNKLQYAVDIVNLTFAHVVTFKIYPNNHKGKKYIQYVLTKRSAVEIIMQLLFGKEKEM
jgi:hypothetical protein